MKLSPMASPFNIIGRQAFQEGSRVSLPPLEAGDHLSQKEFHARYEMMPENIKAELIGGVVYMQSSLKRSHGRSHSLLMHWLRCYEDETPGVEAYDNATAILGEDSEPQPDACLIVVPEKGGQTQFTPDDYLQGTPEFVGEIASSSESYDLHSKKLDYERAGVKEYLVVSLRQKKIVWFVNRAGHFEELSHEPDGFYRSQSFPSLWLDPNAFIALDGKRVISVLKMGMATLEHREFIKTLQSEPEA